MPGRAGELGFKMIATVAVLADRELEPTHARELTREIAARRLGSRTPGFI